MVYGGRAARGPASRMTELVRALHTELDLRADLAVVRFGSPGSGMRPPLRSVYLGGGTPSLLAAHDVGALLEHVERRFGLAADAEITLEANPGAQDRGDLAGFRAAGVTRLSLGAQSLDAAELRALGRRHGPQDVLSAVAGARSAGFADVSLDLLYDTPAQTLASWQRTLERTVALGPDHVSIYALSLELDDVGSSDHLPVRRGAKAWRRRAVAAQDEDRAADMDAIACELLQAAGYVRYEIANWSRPAHESRHNLGYWLRCPYEALGPGAHAFDGDRVRRWNAADLAGYLRALLPPNGAGSAVLPPGDVDVLEGATARAEGLILGLRLSMGIRAERRTEPQFAGALNWGLAAGLLESSGNRLRLTNRGRLLSNELFQRLLPKGAPSVAANVRAVPAA